MIEQSEVIRSLAQHKEPLVTTKRIVNFYKPPTEFGLFTIYAGLGKGKSCYAIKAGVEILMNVYNLSEEEAWEKIKEFIVFHPQQFFTKLDEIRSTGLYRVPLIIWDDAGLWLYALDWNDPFIRALGKYMNVARSRLASLILTTPHPQWIVRKLRGFPDAFNVKITKLSQNQKWTRNARAYQQIMLPDQVKHRVYTRYNDRFSCKYPDEFYWWYQPLRDAYEELAFALIQKAWEESQEKSSIPELSDFPALNLPELKKFYIGQ